MIAHQLAGPDAEIAHQHLDHPRPQRVFPAEGMALGGGEAPLADSASVNAGRGGVLRVALRELRDRRGAEPDEHLGGVIGVALEVAPQPPGLLGDGEPVIGRREVVDADLRIAVPHEQPAGGVEKVEPLGGGGQRLGGDHLLALGHPRHMRIAIKGHPVGREREQLLHRLGDARAGLVRQAVEDIGVEAVHAPLPDHLDRLAGHVVALRPPDGLLDLLVEILHPDRGAVHAAGGQHVEPLAIQFVGVDLDRELGVVDEIRHLVHLVDQRAHEIRRQQRRRAAAPVQARQLHPARQMPLEQVELGLEGLDIGLDRCKRRGALRPAGAEPAKPATERHMQVERYRSVFRHGVDPGGEMPRCNRIREMRGCGVARVPRDFRVEESQPRELCSSVHALRFNGEPAAQL